MRDLIAGLASQAMTQAQAEDFLTLMKGISWTTTRVFCQQLERAGCLEKVPHEHTWILRSTDIGVSIFCEKRQAIPARIVQAALTTVGVNVSEIGSPQNT